MRKDYEVSEITFTMTNYRDQKEFRPPEGTGRKSKRWEVRARLRDMDFKEGITHPDDEYLCSDDYSRFTEWRNEGEDFDPLDAILSLIKNFEKLNEFDKARNRRRPIGKAGELMDFCDDYGNDYTQNLIEDDTVDMVAEFSKIYNLPSVDIVPFTKARDQYWHNNYLFYSTCKFLKYLFGEDYLNILGYYPHFDPKKAKIIIVDPS